MVELHVELRSLLAKQMQAKMRNEVDYTSFLIRGDIKSHMDAWTRREDLENYCGINSREAAKLEQAAEDLTGMRLRLACYLFAYFASQGAADFATFLLFY